MSGKKAPMGWLKGVLSTRDEEHNDQPERGEYEPRSDDINSAQTNGSASYKNIFSRENQDKITLDLIVSVENMLNERQILLFKNKGLNEQIHNANETINRLKHEQNKRDQQIKDYEKEIHSLEDKLTNKQMSYDQLLEDYKEYQNNSNTAIDNLKFQLEKEQSKYSKLDEEMTKHQYQSMQQTKELEERIRDLEAENQKINDQYHKIHEEKNQLLHTINDFTARMSVSFAPLDKSKSESSDSTK